MTHDEPQQPLESIRISTFSFDHRLSGRPISSHDIFHICIAGQRIDHVGWQVDPADQYKSVQESEDGSMETQEMGRVSWWNNNPL